LAVDATRVGIFGAADIPTCSAVRDIFCQLSLAPIRVLAIAVGKTRGAVARTTRGIDARTQRGIVGGTSIEASPAVKRVDGEGGFASVLRVAVAVAIPWRTGDAAEIIRTGGSAMGAVTYIAASSAITYIACDAYLATISERLVAVLVGARAHGNRTDATYALPGSIGGCALGAASAAVVGVELDVGFAAVAD